MIPLSRGQNVVQFTRDSAERIGRAVVAVESMQPLGKPLTFDAILTHNKKTFRICTFTGAWSKNTLKTVTFKFATNTPNTVSASNLFANISTSSPGTLNCAIAKEGTAWYLIAAEC
jgi:hypothetical protein